MAVSSPRTIAAYRDTMRLLVIFAHQRSGKREATRWLISLLQMLVHEAS